MVYPPGIEHGGQERVVRAAGPDNKTKSSPPFLRRKDRKNLRILPRHQSIIVSTTQRKSKKRNPAAS